MATQLRHVWSVVIGCTLAACTQGIVSPPNSIPPDTIRSHPATQSIYVGHCRQLKCQIYRYPVDHFSGEPTQILRGGYPAFSLAFDTLGRRYSPVAGVDTISVYLPGAKTPQATLTLDKQQSTSGIAIDKYDNVWTISNANIFEFARLPADAKGSITLAPVKIIGGPKTHLQGGGGLAFDSKYGYIYTSNGSSILAFDTHDDGNVRPVINLTGKNHLFKYPYFIFGFAVDHNGSVVVSTGGYIFTFAPLATGNAAPVSTINRGYNAVATDAQDNIYAIARGELVEYRPFASGYDAPIRRRPVNPLEGWYPFIIH